MPVGIGNGVGRFGVSGPPNTGSPSGANLVTNNSATPKPFWQTGPFWVIIFLIVGWAGVYRTLR